MAGGVEMSEPQRYPVVIPQNALQAQLQALSLLEARITNLVAQTSWPVHVPFGPKATATGKIVHTNDLKVNLGAGVWVEMTADEAVKYLQRQRERILELQLLSIGTPQIPPVNAPSKQQLGDGQAHQPSVPTESPSSVSTEGKTAVPTITVQDKTKSVAHDSELTSLRLKPKQNTNSSSQVSRSAVTSTPQPHKDVDLVALVEELAAQEQAGGSRTATSTKEDGKGEVIQDDTILNEDGLPFLEIRETIDQGTDLEAEAAQVVSEPVEPDQYWSEDARKRRAALLSKVLGDESAAADDDGEEDQEANVGVKEARVTPASAPAATTVQVQPKSILKPPMRKKSVSFEDQEGRAAGHSAAAAPPAVFPTASPAAFAGFKRGFLSSPLKQEVKQSPVSKIVELPQSDSTPVSLSSAVPSSSSSPPSAPTPKKKSLFAMRKAQLTGPKTEAPSLAQKVTGTPTPASGSIPRLPKASLSKPMTSMKSSVVEHAPEKPVTKVPRPRINSSDSELSEYSDLEDDDLDMDQAMLAREVALEYHKRRSLIPIHNDEGTAEGDEWDRETGQGRWASDRQVKLGLPRLTGENFEPIDVGSADLVHASELSAHIRVGKLENGKLVVAAGDDSDDTEAEEDDEEDEARRRRRELRQQLIAGATPRQAPVLPKPTTAPTLRPASAIGTLKQTAEVPAKRLSDFEVARAATVEPAQEPTTIPPDVARQPLGDVVNEPVVPVKKVSKFKLARAAAAGK